MIQERHPGHHARSPVRRPSRRKRFMSTIPRARRVSLPLAYLALTIVLVGLSFRAPLLSISPLLETIARDTGISAATAGLLTTIPVICFGFVSLLAPGFARRFGMEKVLIGVAAVLVTGILIRTQPSLAALFGGTVVLGAAIAIGNVILPGFIKREAPSYVGPMTALYSAAISGSGALGAGLTIPIMNALDISWRQALAWPAVLAAISLVVLLPWLTQARNARRPRVGTHMRTGVWRIPLAWWVTGYMGMQSFLFFSVGGWLPTYLIAEGMPQAQAGAMLAASPLAGVAGSFIAPLLVSRRPDQRWLIWISSALCAAGIAGFIVWPLTGTLLWVALFGFGSGMTLSLALAFIGLRSPDSHHAADLSGMSQSVGYTIAALGPIAVGLLFDLAGNWTVPMLLILVSTIPLTITGLAAARDRLVAPEPR
jgi:MFS transporter, CP family, cyanate transporter